MGREAGGHRGNGERDREHSAGRNPPQPGTELRKHLLSQEMVSEKEDPKPLYLEPLSLSPQ